MEIVKRLVQIGDLVNIGSRYQISNVLSFINNNKLNILFASAIEMEVDRKIDKFRDDANLENDVVAFYRQSREQLNLEIPRDLREMYKNANSDPGRYLELVLPNQIFRGEILDEVLVNKFWTSELMRMEFSQVFVKLKLMTELQKLIQALMPQQVVLPKTIIPIKWLGNQKELAELFVQLERRGWIDMTYGKKSIEHLFTPSNSILRYLAPGQSRGEYSKPYPNVFTAKYQPRFDSVKKNSSVTT